MGPWIGLQWPGYEGVQARFPSLTFDKLLVFDDGMHRVELRRMGPAHSGGDGVAYLPREKILVTGDLCVNGIHGATT